MNAFGIKALIACTLLSFISAGCSHRAVSSQPGNAGDAQASLILTPAGATRMELEQNQGFAFPEPVGRLTMPRYPAELLSLRLDPVQVCIDVDIDEFGRVTAATPRTDNACVPSARAHSNGFIEATVEAVHGWRFRPAYICTLPDGTTAEDVCGESDAVRTATRIRLPYLVRFTQSDGAAHVSTGQTTVDPASDADRLDPEQP